ncbi:DUF4190 domain-containing protein [Sporosarcina sp. NPDC096371]|uniref:DUF4190 domain-containing protein n=1 Tax=Sporosarcina sp. NPDC096371 TaxID=3364530 RepID=UPI003813AA78
MRTVTGHENLGQSDKNIKATIALILGILSLVLSVIAIIGIVLGIIGLIYGVLALSEIKRMKRQGRSIAIAGVTCSLIGIAFPIILVILFFSLTLKLN